MSTLHSERALFAGTDTAAGPASSTEPRRRVIALTAAAVLAAGAVATATLMSVQSHSDGSPAGQKPASIVEQGSGASDTTGQGPAAIVQQGSGASDTTGQGPAAIVQQGSGASDSTGPAPENLVEQGSGASDSTSPQG